MRKNNFLPSKLFDIDNKNIILTGSAGLLGSHYADFLSSNGANMILIDINEKQNTKLEKSILSKYNTNAHAYTCDLTSIQEIKSLKKSILKDFKTIDVLINNAAYTTKSSITTTSKKISFEKFPFEMWQNSLSVNLTSVFLFCQEFGEIMLKQKEGIIVNISSIYGLVGADQRIYDQTSFNLPVSYAATKGSIINLTKYLAAYWQKKNIRVNTLSLGGVKDTNYQKSNFIKKYSEKTMLGRMANKTDFDGALLFLISNASSYVTGTNLIVDGGWTAW
jgi:NAD(P)-dependent dehydrogenase (short-subunit alcohol dehydrogenase family)